MAPRTRSSVKSKKAKKGRKRRVRFYKKEYVAQNLVKPPENYENLILHYLTKLKRLFGSTDHSNSRVSEADTNRSTNQRLGNKSRINNNMDLTSNRCSTRQLIAKSKPYDAMEIDDNGDMEIVLRNKAFNIVNSAIEYGFANNVLEKRGNYFIMKNTRNSKLANRQPTPGPNVPNKSLFSKCKCHKCRSQKSVVRRDAEVVRPKTTEKLCQQYSNSRPQTTDNQRYRLRSPKTPQLSPQRQSRSNLLAKPTSKSFTNSKALEDHLRNNDCKCSRSRILKMKPSMPKK